MFSGARLCDSCSYTRGTARRVQGTRVCFSPPFLRRTLARPSAFLYAYERALGLLATLSRPRWRFYGVFLRCQVPPLGYAYCTQGFTAGFRTLFASRCLCGRGAIWADISAECPRQVHVKGDYGNLSLLLRVLFARELRDTMT